MILENKLNITDQIELAKVGKFNNSKQFIGSLSLILCAVLLNQNSEHIFKYVFTDSLRNSTLVYGKCY